MDPGLVQCNMHVVSSGGRLIVKRPCYQYRNSHYKDKTVYSSAIILSYFFHSYQDVVDPYSYQVLSVPAWSKRFFDVYVCIIRKVSHHVMGIFIKSTCPSSHLQSVGMAVTWLLWKQTRYLITYINFFSNKKYACCYFVNVTGLSSCSL